MSAYDFAVLENIEFQASIDLFRAAPEDVRSAHSIEISNVGGATCLSSSGIEPASIFRRAVGLGIERPTNEEELDAVLAHMSSRKLRYAVPVAPQSQPPSLGEWLENSGFTRGYAWMKFARACDIREQPDCALDLRVVGPEQGGDFGKVVAEGFGLSAGVARWVGELAGRSGWVCVLAFDGQTAVGSGAAYVDGECAWLGFGATLASHRRRGAQNALLARRLHEAALRGARIAVTETGERIPDKPSNSYRNILRSGFEEIYVRQNFLSPA